MSKINLTEVVKTYRELHGLNAMPQIQPSAAACYWHVNAQAELNMQQLLNWICNSYLWKQQEIPSNRILHVHFKLENSNSNNNCFTASDWDIHPLTSILIINHPLSASSIYYDPWHPPYSIYVLESLFAQPLSSPLWFTSWSSTVHFILHTFLHPIIVFLSQYMPIPSQPVLL